MAYAEKEHADCPLRPVVRGWEKKIARGIKVRQEQWGDFALEAKNYFDGDCQWLWESKVARDARTGYMDSETKMPSPLFRMSPNKTAEMVQLFGPICYYQDHRRTVKPQVYPDIAPQLLGNPMDPMLMQQFQMLMQQQQMESSANDSKAGIFESLLNYIPRETDLKRQSRAAIQEAMITGLSWMEVQMDDGPLGTQSLPTATRVSGWDVVLDPDATCWDDLGWMAIRRVRPYWDFEEQFELEEGSLKKHAKMQSHDAESDSEAYHEMEKQKNRFDKDDCDLMEVWEVYSKQGFGQRFYGVKKGENGLEENVADVLDSYGDYCYLAIAKGIPYPLNVDPEAFDYLNGDEDEIEVKGEEESGGMEAPGLPPAEETFLRVQWPIPFWADRNGWPLVPVKFLDHPEQVYPMSLLKPGAGYMRFLYWAYSFMASKLAASSNTIFAIWKEMSEDFKSAVQSSNGKGIIVAEIEEASGRNINEILSVFQMPGVGPEFLAIINKVEEAFAKATGLHDLVYGYTAQSLRSAAEANIKQANTQGRVEDFARQVDDTFTAVARMQAMAARWFMDGEDVQRCLGPAAAYVWQSQIMSLDLETVVQEFDFRVESGSARRPDRETDIANINQAVQVWGPIFQDVAMNTGQVGPLNALMMRWAEIYEFGDMTPFLIQPPPPPPMPEMGAPQEQPMPAA